MSDSFQTAFLYLHCIDFLIQFVAPIGGLLFSMDMLVVSISGDLGVLLPILLCLILVDTLDYYPEVRFLFPVDLSRGPVQKVLKRIRAIKNHYPNARLSVIAHSFGTYVFLKALEQDTDLEFWKIIFCGSVADDQFEWSDLKRRVGDPQRATKDFVLNDCGTGDAWPVLGAAFGWHYGMAGVTGFSEGFVTNRFHRATGGTKGGHGLYFDPDFVKGKWRPFLLEDSAPEHGDGEQGEHLWGPVKLMYHGWMRICCRLFALMVWLLLLTLLLTLLCGIFVGGNALVQWTWTMLR